MIDLLRNAESVGLTQENLATRLRAGIEEGRFSASALAKLAAQFGRRAEQSIVWQVSQRAAR